MYPGAPFPPSSVLLPTPSHATLQLLLADHLFDMLLQGCSYSSMSQDALSPKSSDLPPILSCSALSFFQSTKLHVCLCEISHAHQCIWMLCPQYSLSCRQHFFV